MPSSAGLEIWQIPRQKHTIIDGPSELLKPYHAHHCHSPYSLNTWNNSSRATSLNLSPFIVKSHVTHCTCGDQWCHSWHHSITKVTLHCDSTNDCKDPDVHWMQHIQGVSWCIFTKICENKHEIACFWLTWPTGLTWLLVDGDWTMLIFIYTS